MTRHAIQSTEEPVRELSRSRKEPGWLLERRVDAWRAFQSMAMPSGFEEEWRRTDLSGFDLEDALLRIGSVSDAVPPPGLTAKKGLGGLIVERDGKTVERFVAEGLDPRLVFVDLHTAAREHPQLVQQHLNALANATDWKLQALHAALWSGGAALYVPPGVELDLPLRYVSFGAAPGGALFPHLLVIASEGSAVTIVQESASVDAEAQSLVSGAVEIFAAPQARVRWFDVQRWGRSVYSFSTVRARLEAGAQVVAASVGLGGRLTRARIEARLLGEGAQAELVGLSFGEGEQHFDYQTLQDHVAPRTTSDLLFKAALRDRASEVWYGTVRIHKGASGSDANQNSRNLLLSDQAKAAPIPVLEIEQYDILRCSHGATAGPIDEEQLFYLESRGIPAREAELMLVEAFFHQVLDRLPDASIRAGVEAALQEKLSRGR